MTRAEALEAVASAAQHLFDAFVKSEASGFRSRERQFAIDMLKPYLFALKATPADDRSTARSAAIRELYRYHSEKYSEAISGAETDALSEAHSAAHCEAMEYCRALLGAAAPLSEPRDV